MAVAVPWRSFDLVGQKPMAHLEGFEPSTPSSGVWYQAFFRRMIAGQFGR
jgi:hypothetical protein